MSGKGQLISECLFDVLNFPKKTTQQFDRFLPKNLKSGQIIRLRHIVFDTFNSQYNDIL
jgi:hypothetical protein